MSGSIDSIVLDAESDKLIESAPLLAEESDTLLESDFALILEARDRLLKLRSTPIKIRSLKDGPKNFINLIRMPDPSSPTLETAESPPGPQAPGSPPAAESPGTTPAPESLGHYPAPEAPGASPSPESPPAPESFKVKLVSGADGSPDAKKIKF